MVSRESGRQYYFFALTEVPAGISPGLLHGRSGVAANR